MPIVIVIYVLINVAYLAVLTPAEIISSTAVATDLGNGFSSVFLWSTFYVFQVSTKVNQLTSNKDNRYDRNNFGANLCRGIVLGRFELVNDGLFTSVYGWSAREAPAQLVRHDHYPGWFRYSCTRYLSTISSLVRTWIKLRQFSLFWFLLFTSPDRSHII